MATKSPATRKAKRQNATKAAEEGLKSARRVFEKFLEKADPKTVIRPPKGNH